MTTHATRRSIDTVSSRPDAFSAIRRRPSSTCTRSRVGTGGIAEGGPLVVDTGRFTGRSPQDKFVVDEPGSDRPDLVGERQPADRRGAVRGAARARSSSTSRLRRRCTSSTRSPAPTRPPDRGARRHREPVPRAVRADDVHRADRRRSSSSTSRRRSSSTHRRSRPIPPSTRRGPGRSSCSIRRAPRSSSGARSTRARSRSRSSR